MAVSRLHRGWKAEEKRIRTVKEKDGPDRPRKTTKDNYSFVYNSRGFSTNSLS